MTRPLAKRQRRLVPSDDDEPLAKPQHSPTGLFTGAKTALPERKPDKLSSTPKRAKTRAAINGSPRSSPRKASRAGVTEEKGNKSLNSFFTRATEEQRWARDEKTPLTGDADGEIGDAIEDDSLDEALVEMADRQANENKVLDRRKSAAVPSGAEVSRPLRDRHDSSQKFAKQAKTTSDRAGNRDPGQDADKPNQVWAERFAPTCLEELAVHRKKVTDVQNWLASVLQGQDRRRLLVLKGPAGSGKTTTLSLLSKAMDFDISAWRNPAVADTGTNSFSSQFDDFLSRGGAFGALDICSSMAQLEKVDQAAHGDGRKRVLLVEEFPATITLSSSAVESFRKVLQQYLAAAAPLRSAAFEQSKTHLTSHPPIIMIISESLLMSATASTDSFTAHKLLGSDLCNHPYATVLEFNPVAPTLVFKALDLTLKKEARFSRRRRLPGPAVLKRLSELGDVRSAVNVLEFLCVRGDADSDWGGRTAAKMRKADRNSSSLTRMESESLELVTQREATLGLFHAVGKVVWNKREDPGHADSGPRPKPPDHLSAFDRPKVPQFDTGELLNEVGTDIQTFIAALHENYVLSTTGSDFTTSVSDCMVSLSESDLLSPVSGQMSGWTRSRYGSRGAGAPIGGIDMLRQNEISFHVAVRGLSFSLPPLVTRAAHPSGRKGDSFKMFYPTSLRLWKPHEEIQDLISSEMGRLAWSATDGPTAAPKSSRAEGVESWKSKSASFQPIVDTDTPNDGEQGQRVWALRDELLLERLPYAARIRSSNDRAANTITRITQFTGSAANVGEEVDDDAVETAVDLSAADGTTDRIPLPQKFHHISRASLDFLEEAKPEKLYISDDIEDD